MAGKEGEGFSVRWTKREGRERMHTVGMKDVKREKDPEGERKHESETSSVRRSAFGCIQ